MKRKLSNLLVDSAMLGVSPVKERELFTEPPNGNSRRNHDENVKRRRLRKLSKKSKQINRR